MLNTYFPLIHFPVLFYSLCVYKGLCILKLMANICLMFYTFKNSAANNELVCLKNSLLFFMSAETGSTQRHSFSESFYHDDHNCQRSTCLVEVNCCFDWCVVSSQVSYKAPRRHKL